ncbi:MAG: hypothetical protein NTY77_18605 [Elusimicrobia bacterium]|nr:hypothetical protein [Elusimicrobiota bacterium]
MKSVAMALVVLGLPLSFVFATPAQDAPGTDLSGNFAVALETTRQGSAQLKKSIAAGQAQVAQSIYEPISMEQVVLKKSRMMAIATSKPYQVRGRNESAYGVITNWAWQNYAEKQTEFLLRRLDFVRDLIAYARTHQPDPQIMEIIHWARSTKFAMMNHPEGQDYENNSIYPFLKDEEFAVLPPAYQK